MARDSRTNRPMGRGASDRWRDDVRGTSANYGAGTPVRGGYGVYNMNGAPVMGGQTDKGNNVKSEKVSLPDKGNRTGKQKKLAKKRARFDEMDLRNYPMTVGSWIGTFILLSIPLLGGICAICWFFGVGNKSRSAWVRSYVVIALLIVLLIGIIFGVGWSLLSKAAKDDVGASSFNEVIFYGADKVITMLEGSIGSDAAESARMVLAQALGIKYTPSDRSENGEDSEGGGIIQGEDENGGIEDEYQDEAFA